MSAAMERLSVVFSALNQRNALKIYVTLRARGEMRPTEMASVVGLSVTYCAQIMRRMNDIAVLSLRQDGSSSYYNIRESFEKELLRLLLSVLTIGHQQRYGPWYELRSDGWPLCPKCGEDEIATNHPSVGDGKGLGLVLSGAIKDCQCLRCGWKLEEFAA